MAEGDSPRELAAWAVLLARDLAACLRDGRFDDYAAGEQEYEALCAGLLRWPLAEFEGEAGALMVELARLQREICAALDGLLATAAMSTRSLRANRLASAAYHGAQLPPPGRTHVA